MCDMIVIVIGWDFNLCVFGIVLVEFKIQVFDNMMWVNDVYYMVILKGVLKEKLDVLFKLMNFLFELVQQVMIYDDGYFYLGLVVKGVMFEMVFVYSQEVIRKFGCFEYVKLFVDCLYVQLFNVQVMVVVFQKWDCEIGL